VSDITERKSTTEPLKEDESASAILLRDGVLLATLTVFIYIVGAVYERAYARRFGIPIDLIELGPNIFMRAFASLLPMLIFAFAAGLAAKIVVPLIPEKKVRVRSSAVAAFVVLVLFAAEVGLNGVDRWTELLPTFAWVGPLVFALFYFMLRVFPPSVSAQAPDSASNSGSADIENSSEFASRGTVRKGSVIIPGLLYAERDGPLIVGIGLMVIVSSLMAGGMAAEREEVFYVLSSRGAQEVALRIYGDRAITAEFDSAKHEVYPEFRVRSLPDSSVVLRLQFVGPLRLALRPPRVLQPTTAVKPTFDTAIRDTSRKRARN
jgi:hypothetical protein